MSALSQKALEVAITQIGQEENPRGSNWGNAAKGDMVPVYLKAVGITFPASWCMAFVVWCLNKAQHDTDGPYLEIPLTGGVLEMWKKVHASYKLLSGEASAPQPGDIGIMDFGNGHGHTFWVESYSTDPKDPKPIKTIEGNSNEDGSANGYEVCRHERAPGGKIIGYLRF